MDNEEFYERFLQYRAIGVPCKKCSGVGKITYGNTSTFMHGLGGQAITNDVCDHCWGTGDEQDKGRDVRALFLELRDKNSQIERLKSVLFVIKELAVVDFLDEIHDLACKELNGFTISQKQLKAIFDELKSS